MNLLNPANSTMGYSFSSTSRFFMPRIEPDSSLKRVLGRIKTTSLEIEIPESYQVPDIARIQHCGPF